MKDDYPIEPYDPEEENKDKQMADDSQKSPKIQLIKAIHQKGSLFDDMAVNDAMEFARYPDDEERKARAIRSVSLADRSNHLAKEIVELVHQFWPKQEE